MDSCFTRVRKAGFGLWGLMRGFGAFMSSLLSVGLMSEAVESRTLPIARVSVTSASSGFLGIFRRERRPESAGVGD